MLLWFKHVSIVFKQRVKTVNKQDTARQHTEETGLRLRYGILKGCYVMTLRLDSFSYPST